MNAPADWSAYEQATQLAANECANHRPADDQPHRCLQLDTLATALLPDRKQANGLRTCRMFAPKPTRCHYFEAALLKVAPAPCIAHYARLITPDKKKAKLAEDALRRTLGRPSADTEAEGYPTDRTCTCGAPIPKRRRMCDSCARNARKNAYRLAKAQKHGTIPQLMPPATLAPQGLMEAKNGHVAP